MEGTLNYNKSKREARFPLINLIIKSTMINSALTKATA